MATQAILAAASGTGATITLYGNDFFGVVILTTGTRPGTGELFRIVMSALYDSRNGYALVPLDANAVGVTTYTSGTAPGMQIDCGQNTWMIVKTGSGPALAASTTYTWGYVMQNMSAVQ